MDYKTRAKRRDEFDASVVYGTRKFNLMTGRDEHIEDRVSSDDFWLDIETGVADTKFTIDRNCPICDTDDWKLAFYKSGFRHVRCNGCTLLYVNNILNDQEYEKLYQNENSWEKVLESKDQVKMQVLEGKYSLDVIQHFGGVKINSICDVGCGPGRLLKVAKDQGLEVLGIEPNQRSYQLLEEQEIPYINDFFPLSYTIDKKYDCIVSLNTFEHLPNPQLAIESISERLIDKGLLYLSVPSADAMVSKVLGKRSGVFGGHSHIQFFNKKTLSNFLEKNGFEILDVETIITEIGVIKNVLDFQDPYFGDCEKDHGFLNTDFLYKNDLARNVNILARKK